VAEGRRAQDSDQGPVDLILTRVIEDFRPEQFEHTLVGIAERAQIGGIDLRVSIKLTEVAVGDGRIQKTAEPPREMLRETGPLSMIEIHVIFDPDKAVGKIAGFQHA
jgi:hypothetical protein